MVDISRETYEGNGIETIVDNDGLLWSNEKHIEEGLDYKNLWKIKTKYHSDQRKHRYEVVEEPKNQFNRTFTNAKLAVKVVMDCRTTLANKFGTRLGFKQCDVILPKEQSVITKQNEFIWRRKYANTIKCFKL